MKNLAVITARSGSKGLPDKNIKFMNGKPLLSYTIDAAIKSGMFDEVFVSTDSEKYADIARKYGASVPFLRSQENAGDTSSSWDAVMEALEKYKTLDKEFETVALLQPTSPLRRAEDIINGYKLMEQKNAGSIVAVCETEHSPLWCNTLSENLSMKEFIPKGIVNRPRQEIPVYYRINGALYIVKTGFLTDDFDIYDADCYAYIMDKKYSIDIDDELDFKLAEIVLNSH